MVGRIGISGRTQSGLDKEQGCGERRRCTYGIGKKLRCCWPFVSQVVGGRRGGLGGEEKKADELSNSHRATEGNPEYARGRDENYI